MSEQSDATVFRLGDLLGHDMLGLKLLTGGSDAVGRRVAGAHAIEIERPTTWLEPEWIMLTTGARLRGNAGAQRELIAELAASGTAALGFGVEVAFKRVPPALLKAAAEHAFPVFTVPLRTPFRDVISTINRALLSSDLRTLQRVSSMQLYLMDALDEDDPRDAVVERLAAFLDATVVLFAPDGAVAASTGDAPVEEIWREVVARPATLVEFDLGDARVLATPVAAGHGSAGWLAVTGRRAPASRRIARQAARATAPVLAALSRIDAIARGQQRAIRAALLDEILRSERRRDRVLLAARAASVGIDFAVPARVVVACRRRDAPGRGRNDGLAEAFDQLTDGLARRGAAHLAMCRGGAITALIQGAPADLHADLHRVMAAAPALVAGVGRPASQVDAVLESHRDATIAVQRLDLTGGARVLDVEDFDLVTLMISETRRERIQPKVDEVLAPLRANPALHEALVAYFAHDLDVMSAARAMHLHHNTLRYRLGRIEESLGRPLKDPATITLLHIALSAERVDPATTADAPAARAGAS
jgi:DNA-binding PucR family transcriptional regulator